MYGVRLKEQGSCVVHMVRRDKAQRIQMGGGLKGDLEI